MTRDELLAKLRKCAADRDTEGAHSNADTALLDYIADDEISELYGQIDKWYA